ncbi:MAG: hypothetical protein WCO44_13010 [Bacteroidota bacterium]
MKNNKSSRTFYPYFIFCICGIMIGCRNFLNKENNQDNYKDKKVIDTTNILPKEVVIDSTYELTIQQRQQIKLLERIYGLNYFSIDRITNLSIFEADANEQLITSEMFHKSKSVINIKKTNWYYKPNDSSSYTSEYCYSYDKNGFIHKIIDLQDFNKRIEFDYKDKLCHSMKYYSYSTPVTKSTPNTETYYGNKPICHSFKYGYKNSVKKSEISYNGDERVIAINFYRDLTDNKKVYLYYDFYDSENLLRKLNKQIIVCFTGDQINYILMYYPKPGGGYVSPSVAKDIAKKTKDKPKETLEERFIKIHSNISNNLLPEVQVPGTRFAEKSQLDLYSIAQISMQDNSIKINKFYLNKTREFESEYTINIRLGMEGRFEQINRIMGTDNWGEEYLYRYYYSDDTLIGLGIFKTKYKVNDEGKSAEHYYRPQVMYELSDHN